MKNIYDGILQFRGKWRGYQERVLINSEKYLADDKLHIVAAPGSGKTTLGIELIRRQGSPCLILSPSITIRQQWLERIEDGFLLPGHEPDKLLSNDLKNMKAITAVTYQALYSAMKNYRGELDENDGESREEEPGEAESVDFRDFHIFDAVKAAGVQTICLDEAHHLRSEWWKALETFMKGLKGMTVIALTATPPYDSTPERRMKQLGRALVNALIEIGEFEDPEHCRAETESLQGICIGAWLKGGTMRDKTTFAGCMEEIWGVIENPRYLLMQEERGRRTDEYYAVPEIFGKQKERAVIFEKHMRIVMGKYHVVYTRTPEGRRILLRARTRSFVNKNQRLLQGRKVAKGKYE